MGWFWSQRTTSSPGPRSSPFTTALLPSEVFRVMAISGETPPRSRPGPPGFLLQRTELPSVLKGGVPIDIPGMLEDGLLHRIGRGAEVRGIHQDEARSKRKLLSHPLPVGFVLGVGAP